MRYVLTTESNLNSYQHEAHHRLIRQRVQVIVDTVVHVVVHVIVAPRWLSALHRAVRRDDVPSRAVFEKKLIVAATTRLEGLESHDCDLLVVLSKMAPSLPRTYVHG